MMKTLDLKSILSGGILGAFSYHLFSTYCKEGENQLVGADFPEDEREKFWQTVYDQILVLFEDHDGNQLSEKTMCLGNFSSQIYHELRSKFGDHSVNWCGFYLVHEPYSDRSTQKENATKLETGAKVYVTTTQQSGELCRFIKKTNLWRVKFADGTTGKFAGDDLEMNVETEPSHDIPSRMLKLGPFQGKSACVHIPFENGVCGAAARSRQTQRVPDVHEFPGHIACDSASESEIVVPIFDNEDILVALLDIDCPKKNGFTELDQFWLEKICGEIGKRVNWTNESIL